MSEPTAHDALRLGMATSIDHLAGVTKGRFDGGPADNTRFIDVRPTGGLHFRVLPDRGFDIGPAWFRNEQLAWLSKVGATKPARHLQGLDWLESYGGGLVVTCGLDNIGAPSEGVGLHGTYSHLSASEVQVHKRWVADEVEIELTATLHDVTALGRHLELRRSLTTRTNSASLTIVDEVTNHSSTDEVAVVLYHVNLGYPFWQPGSTLDIDSDAVEARDEIGRGAAVDGSWRTAPAPTPAASELVWEHLGASPSATVSSPSTGCSLEVEWNLVELPRLFQWTHPGTGVYALGVEPANASVAGRAHDRAEGTLPMLEPGKSRRSGVRITVRELD